MTGWGLGVSRLHSGCRCPFRPKHGVLTQPARGRGCVVCPRLCDSPRLTGDVSLGVGTFPVQRSRFAALVGPGARCGPASPAIRQRPPQPSRGKPTHDEPDQAPAPVASVGPFLGAQGSGLSRSPGPGVAQPLPGIRFQPPGVGGDPAQEIERGSAACRPRVAVGPGIQEYGYRLRPAIRGRSMQRGHALPVSRLDLRAGGDQGVHRCRLAP